MSKQLTILCDMDDVLFPLAPIWVNEINYLFGTSVNPDEITDWDIVSFFPELTTEQIYEPLRKEGFWDYRQPFRDGLWFVDNVIKDGHRLKVVTATHYIDVMPSIRRLLQCYKMLSYRDVIIAEEKQLINGDILIDDAVHNLIDGDYYPILKTMPHNENYGNSKFKLHRVSNLYEAYDIVKKLEGMLSNV